MFVPIAGELRTFLTVFDLLAKFLAGFVRSAAQKVFGFTDNFFFVAGGEGFTGNVVDALTAVSLAGSNIGTITQFSDGKGDLACINSQDLPAESHSQENENGNKNLMERDFHYYLAGQKDFDNFAGLAPEPPVLVAAWVGGKARLVIRL